MLGLAQKLKLNVLWLKDILGLSIDIVVGKQTYQVTQYYFWPRTEAWDQLKLELDSKPWLPEKEKIFILNMATDIITYWRSNRSNDVIQDFKKKFSEATFVELHS